MTPWNGSPTLISTLGRLGLTRLEASAEGGGLPPQSRDGVRASVATGSNLRSFVDEFVQANSSMGEAGAFQDFGAKPLVVLTAGSGSDADLIASHERLTAMSTNSAHRTINGGTHEELIADENDSAATSQAIHDVLTAIRNSTPLSK